jgi:hypothetical protein
LESVNQWGTLCTYHYLNKATTTIISTSNIFIMVGYICFIIFQYYYLNIKILKCYENWNFLNFLKILSFWNFWNRMKILNLFLIFEILKFFEIFEIFWTLTKRVLFSDSAKFGSGGWYCRGCYYGRGCYYDLIPTPEKTIEECQMSIIQLN